MNEKLGTISLKCTGCGASLDITPDLDVFSCSYCGARQIVRRGTGTISLKPLEEAISRVQHGTDRTAAELAVRRLREDLATADLELRRARTDFRKQGGGGQFGLLFIMFGGMGAFALLLSFGQFFLGSVVLIAGFAIPLVFSRSLLSRARITFEEREQQLTTKRNQINGELQRNLALLNNQSA